MKRITIFRDLKPGAQLLFAGFVVVVVFFILQLIAVLIAVPVFGFDRVAGMLGGLDFTNPDDMKLLKYMQVSQSIGLFIAPSIVIAWLYHHDWDEYLQLHKPVNIKLIGWVLLLTFAINPFINFLGGVNAGMHFPEWLSGVEEWMREAEDAAENLTKAFLKVDNIGGLLFNLFMIAVLPALGEELLFRGVIQQLLTRITRNYHWGIWLAAALFSALHMQFYGFIPRMFLGAMFGYLLVWSGSLWLPIVAHFINNAAAVILQYLIDKEKFSSSIDEFGTEISQWYIALISLAVGLYILLRIRQESKSAISSTSAEQHPDY